MIMLPDFVLRHIYTALCTSFLEAVLILYAASHLQYKQRLELTLLMACHAVCHAVGIFRCFC